MFQRPGGQSCPNDTLKEYQRKLRKWPTRSEKKFKRIIQRFCDTLEKEYIFQGYFYNAEIGRHYFVDFYFPFYRAVFEIDGKSHNDPAQAEDDRLRDAFLNKLGLHVYRITNKQTHSDSFCTNIIWQAINRQHIASEKRPKVATDRDKEKQLQAEWLAKKKKRRKSTGAHTGNYQKYSDKIYNREEGLEIQDDPQAAYNQCLKYLKGEIDKQLPKQAEVKQELITRKKRKAKDKKGLCPHCKSEIWLSQRQCPKCMKIREVAEKYRKHSPPLQGAINANTNAPKVVLRKSNGKHRKAHD